MAESNEKERKIRKCQGEMVTEKQEDPFDALQTGLYMDGLTEERDQFPYNMREVREFLSATGKTLDSITPDEISAFRLPGR